MANDFPDWTGPEAVRRLNAFKAMTTYRWPEDGTSVHVRALQQLMVDTGMPAPKDEAEELLDALFYGEPDRFGAIALIRAALAKARGERA